MYSKEVAARKLINRNNPAIIDFKKNLNSTTKYDAIKKVYQIVFKWLESYHQGKTIFGSYCIGLET
jgi:hypothetical protein